MSTLITDLHPCIKCRTWHDVDTMQIYLQSQGVHVLQTGMICPICANKKAIETRNQVLEMFGGHLKYFLEPIPKMDASQSEIQ